jgi:hypothetical protein
MSCRTGTANNSRADSRTGLEESPSAEVLALLNVALLNVARWRRLRRGAGLRANTLGVNIIPAQNTKLTVAR